MLGSREESTGVSAIDLSDGSLRWRALSSTDISSAPTLSNGRVYVTSLSNSEIIALNATRGESDWRSDEGQYLSTPTVANGTVYVGGKTNVVHALDATDGSEQWRYEVDGAVRATPSVIEGTVYVGTQAGSIYALEPADGSERWQKDIGSDITEPISGENGRIYVCGGGTIYALSTDGTVQWSVKTTQSASALSATKNSIVYTDQNIVCLNAATGETRWTFGVQSRQSGDTMVTGIECSPVVRDGVVYAGTNAGDIYAIQ